MWNEKRRDFWASDGPKSYTDSARRVLGFTPFPPYVTALLASLRPVRERHVTLDGASHLATRLRTVTPALWSHAPRLPAQLLRLPSALPTLFATLEGEVRFWSRAPTYADLRRVSTNGSHTQPGPAKA